MNIVITGASRGIGFELVKIFSADSTNSIIAIARNKVKLELLNEVCLKINPTSKVIPLVANLSSEDSICKLCEIIQKKFSQTDILINNAGAIINKAFSSVSQSDLEKIYRVNVFAPILLIQKLLPLMNEKKRSHILNIGSMGGFQGSSKFAGLSAYSSSKAALACLTECLAEEFKTKNISFNCLALGAAQTEMLEEAFPGYKAPMTAAEMATFIANFATNAQFYMNGKIIPISISNP